MIIKIYESGNFITFEEDGEKRKYPKSNTFYKVDNDNKYSFYFDYNKGYLILDKPYTDFRKQDDSSWSSQSEFENELDIILSLNGGGAGRIYVTQSNFEYTLGATIDSTKQYFIDGVIDVGSTSIDVPDTGLSLVGYGFDISKMISTEENFTLFNSLDCGNVFLNSFTIDISGNNSQVFDLSSGTGFEAIEMNSINFENCTSLGELTGFRQGLETNTGRFGGTPELTFNNAWAGGYRISTSIALNMNDFTALFKEGNSLTFEGRFIIGLNLNLPTNGALTDFSASNITNSESLEIENSFIRRNGVINTSDTTITPNIDEKNLESFWSDNVGVANTQKYIRQQITTEVTTNVSGGAYSVLEGTFTVDSDPSHFDSPSNGQLRLLSGNGKYQIFGNLIIDGGPNDVIDLRITKSSDDGATWPVVINNVTRVINSLVGGRDVGFFEINFLSSIKENERIRLEVANLTDNTDVTAELDSTLIVTQV